MSLTQPLHVTLWVQEGPLEGALASAMLYPHSFLIPKWGCAP